MQKALKAFAQTFVHFVSFSTMAADSQSNDTTEVPTRPCVFVVFVHNLDNKVKKF